MITITPTGHMITRDEDHVYWVDGNIMAGVTQVLRHFNLPDYAGVPMTILAAKRAIGTYVHQCVHLYNQGRLDEARVLPVARPYLDAFLAWQEQSGLIVLQSEILAYSETYQYCGQIDLVPPGVIADLKCREHVGDEVGLQLAAYRRAYCEMHGLELSSMAMLCIQLRADGTPNPIWFRDKSYDPGWLNHLGAYNWRRSHRV